jgi:hypothetical protein
VNPLLKGLAYVVRVRIDGPYTPWDTIAAFDTLGDADRYCNECADRAFGQPNRAGNYEYTVTKVSL